MSHQINQGRRRWMGAAAMTLLATQAGILASIAQKLGTEGEIPQLDGATAWLNSEKLTKAGLRGKLVLFDFWTYTCVNWRRTLPYTRAWWEKYQDHGLVVIGVHSPEFSFEREIDNVRWALKDMQIGYPVAVDSNLAVWRAFENEYWPAIYLADGRGRIRYHHFGEGNYQQSERAIQQLLTENGTSNFSPGFAPVQPRGAEVAADWTSLKSNENYTGYERTQDFSSPGGAHPNKPRAYELPTRFGLNHWAVQGDWTATKEAVQLNQANGRIAYQFHARDLNLVMGPPANTIGPSDRGKPIRFRVSIDGNPPGPAHGTDVDEHGMGTVTGQQLYQLIRQSGPIADRRFEIEFLDSGVEAFDFTFG